MAVLVGELAVAEAGQVAVSDPWKGAVHTGTQAAAPKARVAEHPPTAELAGKVAAVKEHTWAVHEVAVPVVAQEPAVAVPVAAVHVETNIPVAP